MSETLYKIRSNRTNRKSDGRYFRNYSLTVPREIAQEYNANTEFSCELTPNGILYRPIGQRPKRDIPDWVTESLPSTPVTNIRPDFYEA